MAVARGTFGRVTAEHRTPPAAGQTAKPEAATPTLVSKDPLHGVTLEKLLTELVGGMGWDALAREVDVRCFRFDPSIKSSLVFLRKTPWARTKVEQLYVRWKRSGASTGSRA